MMSNIEPSGDFHRNGCFLLTNSIEVHVNSYICLKVL